MTETKNTTKKEVKNVDSIRIIIFRSNSTIYGQAMDDKNGTILASSSSKGIKENKKPVEKAKIAGLELGEKISKIKANKIYFDRNNYKYHGRVESFADGIRSAGIKI